MKVNGIFVCHFGCFMETTEKSHFVKHLVLDHTTKELFQWGYKKEKLKLLLTQDDLAIV